jgi:hypothetical protein
MSLADLGFARVNFFIYVTAMSVRRELEKDEREAITSFSLVVEGKTI